MSELYWLCFIGKGKLNIYNQIIIALNINKIKSIKLKLNYMSECDDVDYALLVKKTKNYKE